MLTLSYQNNFLFIITIIGYAILLPVTFFSPRVSVLIFSILSLFSFMHAIKKDSFLNIFFQNKINNKYVKRLIFSSVLFLTWLFISAFWAVSAKQNLISFFKFSGILTAGFIFFKTMHYWTDEQKKTFLYASLIGAIIGSFFLLGDHFLGGFIAQCKKCDQSKVYAKLTLMLSFVGLFPLFLTQNIFIKSALITLFSIVFFFGFCDTADLAFTLALIGYSVCSTLLGQKIIKKLSIPLIIMTFLSLPFILNIFFTHNGENFIQEKKIVTEFSYNHRLAIFKEIIPLILKNPIIGYGIDASQKKEIMGDNKIFTHKDVATNSYQEISYKIHHPHNHILQLWLELGLIGVILWLCVTLSVLQIILSDIMRYKAAFLLFICGHIHLLISISIWQTWWWAFIFMFIPLIRAPIKNV